MPKRGKKAASKKKAETTRSSAFDLPLAPVIRIAKNSGAARISTDGTRAIVARTEKYIAALARRAADSAASRGKKTIKVEDIENY